MFKPRLIIPAAAFVIILLLNFWMMKTETVPERIVYSAPIPEEHYHETKATTPSAEPIKNRTINELRQHQAGTPAERMTRVVDADTKEGVGGAEVRTIIFEGGGRKQEKNFTTNEDGIFHAPVLREGKEYCYSIKCKGYAWAGGEAECALPGMIEIVKGARIAGQVVDEAGNPLALREVTFRNWSIFQYPLVIEGNRFEISNLGSGRYTLYVHPEGYYRCIETVSLEKGETKEIKITCDSGILVTGVVLDTQGSPIEGVFVMKSSCNGLDSPQRLDTTDVSGRFRFRWPEEEAWEVTPWMIYFAKDGYRDEWVAHWEKGPPAEMVILKGNIISSIEGTVTASGVPFEGTLYIDWKVVEQRTQSARPFVEVKEGRFRAHGILPGKHTISVQARGYLPVTVSVEVPEDKPGKLDVVFTDRGGQIRGQIVEVYGLPVRATVCIWSKTDGLLTGPYTAKTEDTGQYAIGGLDDGDYYLQAHPSPGSGLVDSERVTITLLRGEVIDNVDFVLIQRE